MHKICIVHICVHMFWYFLLGTRVRSQQEREHLRDSVTAVSSTGWLSRLGSSAGLCSCSSFQKWTSACSSVGQWEFPSCTRFLFDVSGCLPTAVTILITKFSFLQIYNTFQLFPFLQWFSLWLKTQINFLRHDIKNSPRETLNRNIWLTLSPHWKCKSY